MNRRYFNDVAVRKRDLARIGSVAAVLVALAAVIGAPGAAAN